MDPRESYLERIPLRGYLKAPVGGEGPPHYLVMSLLDDAVRRPVDVGKLGAVLDVCVHERQQVHGRELLRVEDQHVGLARQGK